MNSIKIGARYKHYKGDFYEIIAVGRNSNSLEEVVVYRGLYKSEKFELIE
jgi:hypothetical protein